MLYLQLFWSFVQIGLFSIGGGLAAMPLIQNQVVTLHGWLSMTEFTDLVTIAEMTPGPIAINAATFVGARLLGVPGALVATAGCILPSCILLTILAYLYEKYKNLDIIQGILHGLRPAVVALIAAAGISIFLLAIYGEGGGANGRPDLFALGLFAAAFIVLRRWKPSPVYVMLGCGVVGVIAYGLSLV